MVKKYKSPQGGKQILDTYDELLKAWGVQAAEEDVDTPYGRTHLITAGNPDLPKLVLFHGVGDDSAIMWIANAAELTKWFHIVAVDTMGGPGKSEPNEAYDQRFDLIRWIDAILDAKGLDQVFLAGVSMGSLFTQLYTARRPQRVIGSLCMAGSIAVKGSKNPIWRMMSVFLPEALFPNERNARKLMTKMCGDIAAFDRLVERHPVMLLHWLALLRHFNNQSMMFHRLEGLDDSEISVVRGKTRFLLGNEDRLAYGDPSVAMLRRYGLNFRIVEGAGHALNMEKPDLVHDEMRALLVGFTG